jgi:hypothetical protein
MLTFHNIKSGGVFRRVRCALACRTEPLAYLYAIFDVVYSGTGTIIKENCLEAFPDLNVSGF